MRWEEGGKQRVNTVLTAFSFYNSLVSIYLVSFSFGLEKSSPPGRGTLRSTGKRTDTHPFYRVSAMPLIIERIASMCSNILNFCLFFHIWLQMITVGSGSLFKTPIHTPTTSMQTLCLHFFLPTSGGGSERDFICTQGPLPNTIADFWRMVWEQNVRIVVMVTALKHKDIVRDTYSFCVFLCVLTTVTRKQGPDCFITTINLRHVSERHSLRSVIITHYYYPSWPDRGVPKSQSSLCVFTEHVRQHLEAIPCLGPAVVHCSAGIGRTGTFVTLLWLQQLCARGIRPDIKAAVQDLRLHRMWMVQTLFNHFTVNIYYSITALL
uniref:protein-tyrosine-phosphatase n=1 Tax=Oreochromis aureus TaxID=47969 RepID=A0AAZ1XIB1_OREAU